VNDIKMLLENAVPYVVSTDAITIDCVVEFMQVYDDAMVGEARKK